MHTANIDNVDTILGPIAPGPGVLGRGGVPIPREGPVAAGVIGLAGDTAIPPISDSGDPAFGNTGSGDTGVYGGGPTGVFGNGDVVGIRAKSKSEQAAIFESSKMAQLYLVPLPMKDPTALARSKAGEILVTIGKESSAADARLVASLWFCRFGGGPGFSADWVKLA